MSREQKHTALQLKKAPTRLIMYQILRKKDKELIADCFDNKQYGSDLVKAYNQQPILLAKLKEADIALKELHSYAIKVRYDILMQRPPIYIDLDRLDDFMLLGRSINAVIARAEGK